MLVAYEVVFTSPDHLPVAFLLVPLGVWVALRFDTTVTSGLGVVISFAVVPATLHGLGPFAIGALPTQVVLAQAFVCVTTALALVVALHRDERRHLVEQAQASSARADEQAALLTRVLATMDEGVVLIDASGQLLVRNPAAGDADGGDRQHRRARP